MFSKSYIVNISLKHYPGTLCKEIISKVLNEYLNLQVRLKNKSILAKYYLVSNK